MAVLIFILTTKREICYIYYFSVLAYFIPVLWSTNDLKNILSALLIFKNLFMKSNCFPKQKQFSKKNCTVLHFRKILSSVLMKDSWIAISTSALNLFQYVVLLEVYEENAHRYAFGKMKAILGDFSDNYIYSLIQHENLNNRFFFNGYNNKDLKQYQ